MYFLYSLAWSLALILGAPVVLPFAMFSKRLGPGLGQRFGVLPAEFLRKAWVGGESIWLHAASLGEVNALLPLAKALLEAYPSETFVFTCTTQAGVVQAKAQFPQARCHLLLPLDLPVFLEPYLKALRPKLAVIAETELWPNFLRLLRRQRCLILVANGRLSERSQRRYQRFSGFFSQVVQCVDVLAMQSEEDGRRMLSLGAHPSKVQVEGNTKFDLKGTPQLNANQKEALRGELGLRPGQRLCVAGSTRPGEEEIILKAFAGLQRQQPNLVLLLAPRHLQRVGEVARLLEAMKLPYNLRTALGQGRGVQASIILLDSLGELSKIYGLAELAVIGGSWGGFGGQNPLEPAWQSVPVVFGPHMENFREASQVLVAAGAALQLPSSAELEAGLGDLLRAPARLQAMGQAGRKAVLERGGASQRLLELAQKLLLIREFRRKEHTWRDAPSMDFRSSEFGGAVEKRIKGKKQKKSMFAR